MIMLLGCTSHTGPPFSRPRLASSRRLHARYGVRARATHACRPLRVETKAEDEGRTIKATNTATKKVATMLFEALRAALGVFP